MTEHSAVAEGPAAAERPVLRVVSGEATPEEIAAVVAAVAAATVERTSPAGGVMQDGAAAPTASTWSAPGYAHRNVLSMFTPGPHGWRTSFWPR